MERFWVKADRRGDDECWPWTAAMQGGGYGTFWLNGKQVPAHRVAYWLTHGEWPADEVDHRCHNEDMDCNGLGDKCPHRRCVNPAHLVAATGSENQRARRNRCRRGHPWVTEGVDYETLRKSGNWTCLHCRALVAERTAAGKQIHRSDVCRYGHDLTDPAIAYVAPDGRRQCRTCRNRNQRKAEPLTRSEVGRRGAEGRWGHRISPSP